MNNKYIELKQRRDVGEIVSTYFDFFKQNLKSFTNIFISYNGIFILLLLGTSYLMVTGFIGAFSAESDFGRTTNTDANLLIGAGVLLFFFTFLIIGTLNYSLASSYIIKYDEEKKIVENKQEVWNLVKNNVGRILLFMVLLIFIYLVFIVIS